jgi:pyruvate kinase
MALDLGARVIVACTLTGFTARMISRFRRRGYHRAHNGSQGVV